MSKDMPCQISQHVHTDINMLAKIKVSKVQLTMDPDHKGMRHHLFPLSVVDVTLLLLPSGALFCAQIITGCFISFPFRRISYGPLLDDHNSYGNFTNPVYDP